MGTRNLWALVAFIAASFAAGAIGAAATATSVTTWYATLTKPTWNPPSWVFGPVWAVLYLLMSVAAWRAWRNASSAKEARKTLWLFAAQLGLNALWSALFFGLHRPDLALAGILLLWALLCILLVRFTRSDRLAGLLWAPYVAWVSFASVLNGTIWWLNR